MKQLLAMALLMIQSCLGSDPEPVAEAVGGQRAVAASAYQRTVVSLDAIHAARATDESGHPLALPDPLELRQLLVKGDFERLEAQLASLEAAYASDPHKELWVYVAYEAFELPDTSFQEPLDRWVAQYPDSHRPRVARGEHAYGLAWHARGHRSIPDTTAEQLAAMRPLLERAQRDFRAALERRPDALRAHIGSMDVARTRGDRPAERAAFERASAIHPESFLLRRHHMLALLPRWGGSYTRMDDFAKQSALEAPGNARMAVLYGYRSAEVARTLYGTHPEKAEKYATTALGYAPYWNFFAIRGDARFKLGNTQGALADFDASLALFPLDPRVHANRAAALLELGRAKEAVAAIDRAAALEPTEERWRSWPELQAGRLLREGWELAQQRDFEGALVLYDRAEILDRNHPLLHFHRGRAYFALNDFESARADFERAIALDPGHFQAYRNLDHLLAKRGQWGDIVGYWDRFLARQPDHAGAYLERAGAHRRAGDTERAVADLERACSLGNDDACGYLRQFRS